MSARDVALDVLRAVRETDAYANLLLPARIDRAGLSQPDAALATELTYGTLRMQGYYDRVIAIAARRETKQIDAALLDVLRLGAHQLLSLRTPAHAAVNETVALVGGRAQRGFVNGVLRTIDRSSAEEWRERVAASAAGDDRIAALSSHPAWIVRALRQSLAAEQRGDELDALLEADNASPRVNLVALPGVPLPQGVAQRTESVASPDKYSSYGFTARDPFALVRAAAGAVRVQDEGSQLAAIALVAAAPVAAGERWLDLCAGPGGKAALLGAEALRGGATLLANEVTPARVGLVRAAVAPVAQAVEVVQGDGRAYGTTHPSQFDRVLLDAPCTGLGALRRRPEARWRKQPRDVAELSRLQAELLDSAVGALKPGGVLAYVTCSPHLGETRAIVADALKRHAGMLEELPTQPILQSAAREPLDLAGPETQVQLWPHLHGTDAMFIALLRRARA